MQTNTNKIYTTIGLYPNGDFKINGVSEEHLESHIEYNFSWRWGRALFVNGECIYDAIGYGMSKETLEKFKEQLKKNPIQILTCTAPYV